MKYKLTIACIFSMLVLSSTFGSASVINEKTTEEVVLIAPDECVVYIISPEEGYIYFQYDEDTKPIQGDQGPWPFLLTLDLALYICLGCQFYVDTFLDCPDAECARFSTKRWSDGEEFEFWDCDPSDGFDGYFNLPCTIGLYTETKVDVYDSNDNWLAGDELDFNVLLLSIAPS